MDRETITLARHHTAEALALLDRALEYEPATWAFPVGSVKYPTPLWYCAQYHTWPGVDTHTGCDLNVGVPPYGDIDRDQPVWACTDGRVHETGYSANWLGVVVILIQHEGKPLWVRYAHLDWASIPVGAGDTVYAGDLLGRLGDYGGRKKGDHCHFDMALDPFGWAYYRTSWVRWIDPVPVLKAHLDPDEVDAMLARGT